MRNVLISVASALLLGFSKAGTALLFAFPAIAAPDVLAPADNHATNIKKPLYVVQGKNDPRVPASESVQMVNAIRATGTPVWFLMANDEGHGFGKKRNSDFQFYTTIEFINSFLLH